MRLCSDNALAKNTPRLGESKTKLSCTKNLPVAGQQPALLLRAHLLHLRVKRSGKRSNCPTWQLGNWANKNMRYFLSAGMHLCTSSNSPPFTSYSFSSSFSFCSSFKLFSYSSLFHRFQTFSFAAEKKLLQIYCLCLVLVFFIFIIFLFLCICTPLHLLYRPLLDYNNNHNISPKYICCSRSRSRSCCMLHAACCLLH